MSTGCTVFMTGLAQGFTRMFRPIRKRVVSALSASHHIMGLDIGSRAIKLVQMQWQKNAYRLVRCGITSLERGVMAGGIILDQAKMCAALHTLLEDYDIANTRLAISLAGASVMVRHVSVPIMPLQELERYMLWEGEQYIPGSIDDVYIDYWPLFFDDAVNRLDPSTMSLLLIVAKKEIVEERMTLLQQSGCIPSVLDVEGFALANMYAMNVDMADSDYVMILNIGSSMMNMVMLRGQAPVLIRDASCGSDDYIEKIYLSLDCDRAEAEAVFFCDVDKESVIMERNGFCQDIIGEVRKTLDHFGETVPNGGVRRLVVCGGYARVVGLLEALQEGVGIPVEQADPFHAVDTSDAGVDHAFLKQYAHMFGVGVGLARRTVGDR